MTIQMVLKDKVNYTNVQLDGLKHVRHQAWSTGVHSIQELCHGVRSPHTFTDAVLQGYDEYLHFKK